MNLKEMLGEAYSDSMSIDEINTALADKDFVDKSTLPDSVPKTQFDAKLTELSKTKKELKALREQSLSDDERQKQILKDAEQAKSDYLKKSVRLDVEKVFVSAGLNEEDYKGFIDGIVSEDTQKSTTLANEVCKMISNQKKSAENAVRKELHDKLSEPPSGGNGSTEKESFEKMSLTDKMKFKTDNPEIYKGFYGGN